MQKWARDMVEDKLLPRYVNDNDFAVVLYAGAKYERTAGGIRPF